MITELTTFCCTNQRKATWATVLPETIGQSCVYCFIFRSMITTTIRSCIKPTKSISNAKPYKPLSKATHKPMGIKCLLTGLLTHSKSHSLIQFLHHSNSHSLTQTLIHSNSRSLKLLLTEILPHSNSQSLKFPLTQILIYSTFHLLKFTLTKILTHWNYYPLKFFSLKSYELVFSFTQILSHSNSHSLEYPYPLKCSHTQILTHSNSHLFKFSLTRIQQLTQPYT